jgi:hypothetical protein
MRRQRKVLITGPLMAEIFGKGTQQATAFEKFSGMAVRGAGYDPFMDLVWIIFEHEEFAEVPDGAEPPLWEPTFYRETA